jgi:hypothetical protein
MHAFLGQEADMRRVIDEQRADYVVLCSDWAYPAIYGHASFGTALAQGAAAPWLEPVAIAAGPLRVWRVLR